MGGPVISEEQLAAGRAASTKQAQEAADIASGKKRPDWTRGDYWHGYSYDRNPSNKSLYDYATARYNAGLLSEAGLTAAKSKIGWSDKNVGLIGSESEFTSTLDFIDQYDTNAAAEEEKKRKDDEAANDAAEQIGDDSNPEGPTIPEGPIGTPSTDNPNDPNYVGDPNATYTAAQRRKRLTALRRGLQATIKTSPTGVATAAQTLSPSVMASGLKARLGA